MNKQLLYFDIDVDEDDDYDITELSEEENCYDIDPEIGVNRTGHHVYGKHNRSHCFDRKRLAGKGGRK